MNHETVENVLFEINGKLSSIETKIDSMSENILRHEARLTTLEHSFNQHCQDVAKKSVDGFKMEMLRLLGKCLVISLSALSVLVGGGSILTKIIGF